VKLYSYSLDPPGVVEIRWVKTKIAACAAVIGAITFFGFIELGAGDAAGSHPAEFLASENKILKQELSMMTPRVTKLEVQVKQLSNRANALHELLHRPKIAADSLLRPKYSTKEVEVQSTASVVTGFRP
jgi:hypothetical protein